MQITSRFTVAIHTMICIAYFQDKKKVTSNYIAASVNANPVVIRRIMGQLKAAGLVDVKCGVGGATIAKALNEITIYDIFMAVEAVGDDFFNFHENPNCKCPIGANIHQVLDCHLGKIQNAMNIEMKKTTLETLLEQTKHSLAE